MTKIDIVDFVDQNWDRIVDDYIDSTGDEYDGFCDLYGFNDSREAKEAFVEYRGSDFEVFSTEDAISFGAHD